MKKGELFLISLVFLSIFFIAGTFAQEETGADVNVETDETDDTGAVDVPGEDTEAEPAPSETAETIERTIDISTIDETAELQETEGITPDSSLYFVDEFLDKFGDEINLREEKIAEIRAMIQQGKIEEAKIALENYKNHADSLEQEVSPEERDEARRSAAAIYNTMQEIEAEVPEDFRREFVNGVVEKEGAIITAVEIAGKIKSLCEELSKIDPLEYSRVCRTDEDSPDWQKKLHRDLTEEQRREAKLFGDIMSECFRTAGRQCRCEEIPFTDFAETCSIAAPLATACEIDGNEEACAQLDDLEMPELPEHLQDVFDSLEGNIRESQFDVHLPPECREANTRNANQCVEIMFRRNAPGPCLNALDRGEISFTNEREAREVCEKIMFEESAPRECVEKGLTDFRECGKLMFQLNAPQECIDAGLTGENRGDEKKCRLIMESQGLGPEGMGPPALGVRCREIQNSEERLRCYDSATQGIGERAERVEMERTQAMEYRQIEGQKCPDNICDEFEQTHPYACPVDCGGIQEFQQPQQEFSTSGESQESPEERCSREEGTWDGSICIFSSAEPTTPTESATSTQTEPTTSENSGTTGAAIDNKFFNYYFG